jgi:putative transposase
MVAHKEQASLATRLIAETCKRQNVVQNQLTIHADRGSSMKSKPVAFLLADLGVTKSHSRPHVSNDNPFSESQFKTMKYRPEFPDRFGSIEDSRAFCVPFFDWYNLRHKHTGIGLFTPAQVHYGQAQAAYAQRASTLEAAFAATPIRFKGKVPKPMAVPKEVWINPPSEDTNLQ